MNNYYHVAKERVEKLNKEDLEKVKAEGGLGFVYDISFAIKRDDDKFKHQIIGSA